MSESFSRRRFLSTALAAGMLPILPGEMRASPSASRRLIATMRMLEVNGRSAKVFGLEGPDGRQGIRLAAGERFQVELANESGTRRSSIGMSSFRHGPRMVFLGRDATNREWRGSTL